MATPMVIAETHIEGKEGSVEVTVHFISVTNNVDYRKTYKTPKGAMIAVRMFHAKMAKLAYENA